VGGKGHVCLSFDDYHPANLKIDEILHEQGLEATFFIETGRPEARKQIEELYLRGHDIGAHTISHPGDMKLLNRLECVGEVEGSKRMIEQITDRPCTVFAYPRGRFNDEVVAVVRRAGFEEARTTHVLKTRWDDPMRQPTTLHLYDGRKEYNGRDWMALAEFYLADVVKNGGTFSEWGHAFENERDNLWTRLVDLCSLIGENIEA
jgi:peptidoglycan/xylan/chitin deacetylase (PgdA/CDA1 family)